MGGFNAEQTVKLMTSSGRYINGSRIQALSLTFKRLQ